MHKPLQESPSWTTLSSVQWALFPVDVHNSVGQGKVTKIEKSSSGEFMVLKWNQAFLLVYDSLFCNISIN